MTWIRPAVTAIFTGMANRSFDIDRVIIDLAARQHGVVSSRQLCAAGVTRDALTRRLRAGMVRRVFRGVYRVGPVVAPYAREMAAVLACDGRVFISHRTGAAMKKVTPPQPADALVDVIAPYSNHGRRHRIMARRSRSLRADETTSIEGIPVTTVERTLMDLAGVAGAREVERAVAEAFARRLTDRGAILRVLARHAGESGVRQLQTLLASREPALTKSEAEEEFLRQVRSAGLPEPRVNAKLLGHEVDFYWPGERFVVEVDGWAYHSSSQRFERDRQRDGVLAAKGVRVMRVTWRQLTDEPTRMLVRLAQALALAGRSA